MVIPAKSPTAFAAKAARIEAASRRSRVFRHSDRGRPVIRIPASGYGYGAQPALRIARPGLPLCGMLVA
ncbi:MAG: hypothetical protein WCY70_02975 [Methanoculleus sp.]